METDCLFFFDIKITFTLHSKLYTIHSFCTAIRTTPGSLQIKSATPPSNIEDFSNEI